MNTSSRFILLSSLCLSPWAWGQPFSFMQAQEHLFTVSDALHSAQSQVSQKEQQELASHSLSYPDIALDVKEMRFSKTVDLSPINGTMGLLHPGAPMPEQEQVVDWRTRPIVTATLPLWTGGKIQAGKAAAKAAVTQAQASQARTEQTEITQLVQAYFGQLFTQEVLTVRQDVRDGLAEHLDRAIKLEAKGFATKAQRLQAQVAVDNAERELRKAKNDLAGAQAALMGLLRQPQVVEPSSKLFMHSQPLPEVAQFLESLGEHPSLKQIEALKAQADEQVRAQKADFMPQFYAFGQYDLKKEDALLTESDWAFGVGMKLSLLSNHNRYRQVKAAQSQGESAQYSLQDAQVKLSIAVQQAWFAADSAQQQFALLESALESAQENLRLQDLSFQAGRATSLDVIDARLQLGKVRIERAQAAWQFDLALAQLLDVSGQSHNFVTYLQQADKVL
ncbi:MAG: hypothetical protein RL217_1625 [Pseudomonadota bacterium]